MSDWSGGYGDELLPDEILPDYESWLHVRAWRMRGDANDHDDLVQEGRIGAWKGLATYRPTDGALPSWVTTHAEYAMRDAVSHGRWTGQPPRNTNGGGSDFRAGDVSLDALMADEDGLEALLGATELGDAVLLAYHRGEIAAALASLSPKQKEYVILRFWGGFQSTDLKIRFGYDPQGLWSSPKNGAKQKLRAQLAHLVDA